MLIDLKRAVAFVCPVCSNMSSKILNVFDFSGNEKVPLICPTHSCHETCVYISQKGAKYKLDIDCPLCGEKHSYTASREHFWHKPLITYKCPVTGIDIFFAGEESRVEQALDENCELLSDIADEFASEDSSFSVVYAIIERLHSLIDNHRVSCSCGNDEFQLNVANGNILVTCSKCNKSKLFDPDEETLMRLLNANAIVIGSRK